MTDAVCAAAGMAPASPPREAAEPLEPGLDQRLVFMAAHDILAGLAACTPEHGALTLPFRSEQLNVPPLSWPGCFSTDSKSTATRSLATCWTTLVMTTPSWPQRTMLVCCCRSGRSSGTAGGCR